MSLEEHLYACWEWLAFSQLQHILLYAEHCLSLWFIPHVVEFFHGLYAFCLNGLKLCSLLAFFTFFIMSNSLVSCKVASIAFCYFWTSTLLVQASTYSLVSLLVFLIVVSPLIMLNIIACY